MITSFPPGPIRQECEELSRILTEENKAKDKKAVAELDEAIAKAAETVRTARTAAELDDTISLLRRLNPPPDSPRFPMGMGMSPGRMQPFGDPHVRGQFRFSDQASTTEKMRALNLGAATLNFLAQWQEYLAALTSGRKADTAKTLRELSQSADTFLIPRSEILTRIAAIEVPPEVDPVAFQRGFPPQPGAAPQQVAELDLQIRTLAELSPALDAFGKIAREGDNPHRAAAAAIEYLSPLEKTYRMLRAGLPTSLEIVGRAGPNIHLPSYGPFPMSADVAGFSRDIQNSGITLREQLLLLALPRCLDLPGASAPKPGEGPAEFLERVKLEALGSRNFPLAAHVVQIREFLVTGSQDATASSQAKSFLAATRQEAAGQFALAVASYQQALAAGAALVPAEVIGERLDALKAAHAQEYRFGISLYLPPMLPQAYPDEFGMPLQDTLRPAYELPPSLSVPKAAPPVPPSAATPSNTPPK